jgi:hypothetical protein
VTLRWSHDDVVDVVAAGRLPLLFTTSLEFNLASSSGSCLTVLLAGHLPLLTAGSLPCSGMCRSKFTLLLFEKGLC